MWIFAHYFKKNIASALKSRMCEEDWTASLTATVTFYETQHRKRSRSYSRNVSYPLKKYSADTAIADLDATILSYMRPTSAIHNYMRTAYSRRPAGPPTFMTRVRLSKCSGKA